MARRGRRNKNAKVVSIGGRNVREGSKSYSEKVSAGGAVAAKIQGTARPANMRRDATGNFVEDRLTTMENNGVVLPEKMSAEDVATMTGQPQTPPTPGQVAPVPPTPGQPAPMQGGLPSGTSVPYAQAVAGLQSSGASSATIASATNILKAKYGQGLQSDIASGTPAGQNLQDGLGSVSQFAQTQQESPSILGGLMESDAAFDTPFTDLDKWMSPESQRTSLVDEYKTLSKSLGIEDLNEELIDAQKIIDGTEDDIRNEITAAGGFGTDSQVMAMSAARNKSLIKNYNALLATRDNATQQLSTMMQLSVQDRQFAEAEFDRKINFAFKVQEFKQRAVDNARQTYLTLGDRMGWDTLLTQASPYEQNIIGRTLGLGAGGLRQLAQASAQQRFAQQESSALDLELKRSQLETDKVQRANINDQIRDRNIVPDGVLPGQTVTIPQIPISRLQTALVPFLASDKVPAAVRDQIRKALVLVNKANSLVEKSPDKNFAGGRATAFFAPLFPAPMQERYQVLKADESMIRQNLVNYITGAAYTSLQEDDVNKIIPRSQLWDSQNVQKTTELVNTVLGDLQAALLSSGFDVQLPQYDDLWEMNEIGQMMDDLSPEQEAELKSLGLL